MPATAALESPRIDVASQPFVLRWNHLVSVTNWEKGRIILDWRKSQKKAGAPVEERSDEAWATRVGQVSPPHVGRLRRVFEKFGKDYESYEGLYWSHFSAAMDWDDAEMWLEGASRNGWSISQMRNQRWEALGAPADKKPRPEDVIATELEEEVLPPGEDRARGAKAAHRNGKSGPDHSQGPDFGGERGREFDPKKAAKGGKHESSVLRETHAQPVRPFEELPELPDDLSEAFELFKLSLLRHKLSGWREVALDDVLSCLEGLKRLALAPSA